MSIPGIIDLSRAKEAIPPKETLVTELFPELSEEMEKIREIATKRKEELTKETNKNIEMLLELEKGLPHNEETKTLDEKNLEMQNILKDITGERNIIVEGLHIPVRIEGNDEDITKMYMGNEVSDIVRFLALSNVDLKKVDIVVLKEFIDTNRQNLKNAFSEGYIQLHRIEEDLGIQIKGLLAEPLLGAIEEITKKDFDPSEREKLEKLLQIKAHLRVPQEYNEKVIEQLYSIIDSSKGAYRRNAYDFFMDNEIFLWDHLFVNSPEVVKIEGPMEVFMQKLHHIDNEEVIYRRTINEENARIQMRKWSKEDTVLNVDKVRKLQSTLYKGLLPFFSLGIRSDKYYTNHTKERENKEVAIWDKKEEHYRETTPSKEVTAELTKVIERGNNITASNMPKLVFETAIATLLTEYINMHPHTDGNGTTSLMVAECFFMKRGYPEVTCKIANTNIYNRMLETFRYNWVAITAFTGKYFMKDLITKH